MNYVSVQVVVFPLVANCYKLSDEEVKTITGYDINTLLSKLKKGELKPSKVLQAYQIKVAHYFTVAAHHITNNTTVLTESHHYMQCNMKVS